MTGGAAGPGLGAIARLGSLKGSLHLFLFSFPETAFEETRDAVGGKRRLPFHRLSESISGSPPNLFGNDDDDVGTYFCTCSSAFVGGTAVGNIGSSRS